jgi:hypothetical protein
MSPSLFFFDSLSIGLAPKISTVLTSPTGNSCAKTIGEYGLSSTVRAFEDFSGFVLQQECLSSGVERYVARFMQNYM